jgi:hypothetical protein
MSSATEDHAAELESLNGRTVITAYPIAGTHGVLINFTDGGLVTIECAAGSGLRINVVPAPPAEA